MNLYGFVGNDGVDTADPLGLMDHHSPLLQLEAEAHELLENWGAKRTSEALNFFAEKLADSEIGRPTGLSSALDKLKGMSGYGVTGVGADAVGSLHMTIAWISRRDLAAFYAPGVRTVYLTSGAGDGMIVHELVHAWNHLNRKANNGSWEDEGMAHLMMYGLSAEIGMLIALERMIKTSSCDELKTYTGWWTEFWNRRFNWISDGWGNTTRLGISQPRTQGDFINLRDSLGVNFSCESQSRVINRLLLDRHCCIKVRCTRPEFRVDEDGFFSFGSQEDVAIEY